MATGSSRSAIPVVFSLGDPHGIGPEVLLKAISHYLPSRKIIPTIVGDPAYLKRLRRDLQLPSRLDDIEMIAQATCPYPPAWGSCDARAGRIALDCLQAAVSMCRERNFPLLVTAPVSKKAIELSGQSVPGQTEVVASQFPGCRAAMAFFSDSLHVLLLTVHVPLRRVFDLLTIPLVVSKSALFCQALQRIGYEKPRIALAGLNPHASEEGLFGDEEERILLPALERLEQKLGPGIFSGPFPPDTIFRRAFAGAFDGVVAPYHDQGLIPIKLLAFDSAVNVTLGLPIVRTSPDHGTAFDIAGQGKANPSSMIAAIDWGLRLAAGPI